jgi:hypothetical protein
LAEFPINILKSSLHLENAKDNELTSKELRPISLARNDISFFDRGRVFAVLLRHSKNNGAQVSTQ